MDELMARTIVETLSKGINPLTGRVLPENSICSDETIQAALEIVLEKCTIESNEQILKRLKEEKKQKAREKRTANEIRYINNGKPWTEAEKERLIELSRYYSTWKISTIMKRSPGAIRSALDKYSKR